MESNCATGPALVLSASQASDLQRLYEQGAAYGLRCRQCDNDADFEPLAQDAEYAWICGACGWKISHKAAERMTQGDVR